MPPYVGVVIVNPQVLRKNFIVNTNAVSRRQTNSSHTNGAGHSWHSVENVVFVIHQFSERFSILAVRYIYKIKLIQYVVGNSKLRAGFGADIALW